MSVLLLHGGVSKLSSSFPAANAAIVGIAVIVVIAIVIVINIIQHPPDFLARNLHLLIVAGLTRAA